MKLVKSVIVVLALAIIMFIVQTSVALAHDVKVTFTPSPDPRAVGHYIYYGSPEVTQNKFDIKDKTEAVFTLENDTIYKFGATAYDVDGNESVMSDILLYETPKAYIPLSPPVISNIIEQPPVTNDQPNDGTTDTPEDTPNIGIEVEPIDNGNGNLGDDGKIEDDGPVSNDDPVYDTPDIGIVGEPPVNNGNNGDLGDDGKIEDDGPVSNDDPVYDTPNIGIVGEPPVNETPFIQTGIISVDSNTTRIYFDSHMKDPIVVATPVSSNDPTPVTVLVTNVDPDGFDITIRGYDTPIGHFTYGPETVSFLAVEKGVYELPNGAHLEAGTIIGKASGFQTIDFKAPFADAPVVITTVSSNHSKENVTGRLSNISKESFDYVLMKSSLSNSELGRTFTNATGASGTEEVVSYIAIEKITDVLNGSLIEANTSRRIVTHKPNQLFYKAPFFNVPVVLADIQTSNELDTCNLRYTYSKNSGIELYLSKDVITRQYLRKGHKAEVVGFIAISIAVDKDTPVSTTD